MVSIVSNRDIMCRTCSTDYEDDTYRKSADYRIYLDSNGDRVYVRDGGNNRYFVRSGWGRDSYLHFPDGLPYQSFTDYKGREYECLENHGADIGDDVLFKNNVYIVTDTNGDNVTIQSHNGKITLDTTWDKLNYAYRIST